MAPAAGESGGMNFHLFFAIIATSLGSGFQHGYHTGVINVPQEVLSNWLNETMKGRTGDYLPASSQKLLWGLTTSIMNVGGTVGGLLAGLIALHFGPKDGLFLNNGFVIVSTSLMALSKLLKSLEVMILGRFIIGVACGLCAGLCPMYLSEVSPTRLRGAIGSVYQLIITISILIAQIVGMSFTLGTEASWPYLFVIPLFFAAFQVITLPFSASSPKYLLSKAKDEKAQKALVWLRKTDDVQAEMAELKAERDALKAMDSVRLIDMFQNSSLRKPLMIALILMIAQQFSGINAVIFYSTGTFESTGLSKENAQLATLGIGTINVLMTIVSLVLVDIAGRKTLLLIGFGGMAIDMLLLTLALKFAKSAEFVPYICIILVFCYIILFAAGAGSIPWFLVTELFNQSARGTAVSLAVPANWIANFIVTLTFPSIENGIGPFVFLIFVILDCVFFVFILKFVPETKNKSIDEITSLFL